jgi:hypothetical protein
VERHRQARVIAGALIAVLLLNACGGGGEPQERGLGAPVAEEADAPATDEEAPPPDPLTELAASARTSPEKGPSLELFAAMYGPVAGTEPPDVGDSPPRGGSQAISAVFSRWQLLDADERAAVREHLDLPADYDPPSPTAEHPPLPPQLGVESNLVIAEEAPEGRRGRSQSQPARTIAPYARALQRASDALESHLGPLGRSIVLQLATPVEEAEEAAARRRTFADTAVQADGSCRIRVYAELAPPARTSTTLGHELMHCYQQVWRGSTLPDDLSWVEEGTAEWAGNVANQDAGGQADGDSGRGFLGDWIVSPGTGLFARDYDAWPWFAYAQEMVPGLWGRLQPVVRARSSTDALSAAVGGEMSEAFVSEWATSQVWRESFGENWVVNGRGVPADRRTDPADYFRLANGDTASLQSAPYANDRKARRIRAEVLRVRVGAGTVGVARIDGEDSPLAELANRSWCTDPESDCICPAGTRRAGQALPRLAVNELFVAAGGGSTATSATFEGRSLRDECDQADECPVGVWRQEGPIAIPGITSMTGGGGTIMTIEPDGRIRQNFDMFEPLTATGEENDAGSLDGGSTTVYLAPRGEVTARITMPPPGTPFAGAEVRDVDASGLTGEAWTEVDAYSIEFTIEELRSIIGGIIANRSQFGPSATVSPVQVVCASEGELVLDAGGGRTQSWVRAD